MTYQNTGTIYRKWPELEADDVCIMKSENSNLYLIKVIDTSRNEVTYDEFNIVQNDTYLQKYGKYINMELRELQKRFTLFKVDPIYWVTAVLESRWDYESCLKDLRSRGIAI